MSGELMIAIIGVGGTLLASVGSQWAQALHSRHQRAWTAEDLRASWARERESRLFESKRLAYLEFIEASEQLSLLHYDSPAYSSQVSRLYKKLVAVQLYGSVDAVEIAVEVFGQHAEATITDRTPVERKESDGWADTYRERFVEKVRADLGVDASNTLKHGQ